MSMRRPLWVLMFAVLLGLVVTGLIRTNSAASRGPWSQPGGVTATPVASPEAWIARDCGLSQKLAAWVDRNANGQREPDEPPLARVEFFVVSTFDEGESWDHGLMATSDGDGEASIHHFIGGCSPITFDFTARPRGSYRATTPQPARLVGYGGGGPILFGFAPEP